MTIGQFPLQAFADQDLIRITILHTNDVHSRIDPFPMDGTRNAGQGGAARRAAMIGQVRQEEKNVLVFDSGDIFQGTPYFNFFQGDLEIKLMNEMGYDAATIGNHDFDAGIDQLALHADTAAFPFLNVNYDFRDTVLNGKVQDYRIFERDGIRIGVTGVGIELEGLVPKSLSKETQYLDPVERAQATATMLRHEMKCDYVVVLSHLGYKYKEQEQRISDVTMAKTTRDIDLILGGHTHTFMKTPDILANKDGKPVIIHQVGWAGILLGRIDLVFERNRGSRCVSCKTLPVSS